MQIINQFIFQCHISEKLDIYIVKTANVEQQDAMQLT